MLSLNCKNVQHVKIYKKVPQLKMSDNCVKSYSYCIYKFFIWYDIREIVVTITSSFIQGYCCQGNYLNCQNQVPHVTISPHIWYLRCFKFQPIKKHYLSCSHVELSNELNTNNVEEMIKTRAHVRYCWLFE
jgi:hypothetical protein